MLAAVEIEITNYLDGNRKQFKDEIGRVMDGLTKWETQIQKSYVLIACVARRDDMGKPVPRQLCDYANILRIREWVRMTYGELYSGTNIKVYWTSDHPNDESNWI